MHFSDRLVGMDACSPAVKWAETMPDVRTAYAKCPDGHWLEWLLQETSGWPKGAWLKYEAGLKPLDDEYNAKSNPIYSEFWGELGPIYDEYVLKRRYTDDEYDAIAKPITAKYFAKQKPLDDEHYAKVADLIRSLVPVEVFLKILEES